MRRSDWVRVLCAGFAAASMGGAVASADIRFATDAAEYVVAPGGSVDVRVYLEFTSSDIAALTNEEGVYGTGVRLRTIQSLPSSSPAAVTGTASIFPNMAQFDDPFGAISDVGDGFATLLVTVDPFSNDGDLGALGTLEGTTRRIKLGTFRYTAASSFGEVTSIQIGDLSALTDDTVTWRSFTVLDTAILSHTISIRTADAECPSDYTGDGEVDILDLLDFIQDLSDCTNLPAPCGQFGNPDVNGDTFVDILDLLDFIQAFSDGC